MDSAAHFLIPFIIGLAVVGRKHWKKILVISFIAMTPDIDIFVSMHRALFHNIFYAMAVGLIAYFVSRALWRERARLYGALSFLAVILHFILDLGKPGYALLWPFSSTTVFLEVQMNVYGWMVMPVFGFGFGALDSTITEFSNGIYRGLLSNQTFLIAIALAVVFAFAWALEKKGLVRRA